MAYKQKSWDIRRPYGPLTNICERPEVTPSKSEKKESIERGRNTNESD